MDVERDLEYVYGWNRYTMRFMGIWPEDRNFRRVSSYKALVPIVSIVSLICVPQTADLVFIWGDFDLVVENLSMANITITIAMLKTVIFWLNGGTLELLLNHMANDWRNEVKTTRRHMLEVAKASRMITKRSALLAYTVVITYVVLRYLSIRQGDRRLFFRGYFPYDTKVSPNYELTFVGQIVASTYAATTYTAVDTFVAMLVLHVCGQMSNLRKQLESLGSKSRGKLRAELRCIVRKHEYLNRFADTIEESFNLMLLAQMLGCTVQLCFQGFQAFTSILGQTGEVSIFQFTFLLIYVSYVLIQLYLYCYVGERIFVESTEISYAAYNCEWYNFSPSDAKLLLVIMCRARSPLRITAGKFCFFSQELYSQVLKTSVGYMSVLYAMKSKTSNDAARNV